MGGALPCYLKAIGEPSGRDLIFRSGTRCHRVGSVSQISWLTKPKTAKVAHIFSSTDLELHDRHKSTSKAWVLTAHPNTTRIHPDLSCRPGELLLSADLRTAVLSYDLVAAAVLPARLFKSHETGEPVMVRLILSRLEDAGHSTSKRTSWGKSAPESRSSMREPISLQVHSLPIRSLEKHGPRP